MTEDECIELATAFFERYADTTYDLDTESRIEICQAMLCYMMLEHMSIMGKDTLVKTVVTMAREVMKRPETSWTLH